MIYTMVRRKKTTKNETLKIKKRKQKKEILLNMR